MSESGSNYEEQRALAQLELMVRAAGEYVQPTDDLRPSTLEASRQASHQNRRFRRISSLVAMLLLLAATGFPGSMFSSPAITDSAEMHRRAALSATQRGVGPNWALFEVFHNLRQDQAELLNPAD